MFKTPQSRYLLRAAVTMILAGLSIAGTIWIDNPYIKIASGMVAVLASYLGIGIVSPQVEPFVGNKMEDAQVPVPPADPV